MTKRINLKKIKEKDIVHFLNGGKATIGSVQKGKYELDGGTGIGIDQIFETRILRFEEASFSVEYTLDGKPVELTPHYEVKTIFDIIEIEPYVEKYLFWNEVDDSGEFIQKKGVKYPLNSIFKMILGKFTLMDENGRKKDQGLL